VHIPDGFLSGELNAAAFAITAGVAALAVKKAGRDLDEKRVPLLGVAAAFVFASQMVQFPIFGGTSGHFLGAFLSVLLLGPLNGFLVLALVLTVQCLLFADGGLTALGTNVFNLGLIGGIASYYLFFPIRFLLPKTRAGFLASAAAASWCSVTAASLFCALELALSGTLPLGLVLPAMAGVYSVIGIGEAFITVTVVSMVLSTRPDLIWTLDRSAPWIRSGEQEMAA
jgi:cobalt/nickel transport system permease protein